MDSLTEAMETSQLIDNPRELEQLLFRPQESSGLPETALDNIPRYLFRVASLRSGQKATCTWVHSESAFHRKGSSMEDAFLHLDNEKGKTIARRLNRHLRWWPNDEQDNFVSWTSSLLFAIEDIYYRHLSNEDVSRLDEIELYVIDTTLFSRGTFLRDLDLIRAFRKFDDHPPKENLEALQSLRESDYYFGEYLSQGSLKIENKCEMISASVLFRNDRLRRLQPEFHSLSTNNGKPERANEVNRLRKGIWPAIDRPILSIGEMCDRLEAIKEITHNVASGWELPLAIYFAALIGSESTNTPCFFRDFRSLFFNDREGQRSLEPWNFNTVAPDTMPEIKQVQRLVREIYKYNELEQVLGHLQAAAVSMDNLYLILEDENESVVADSNKVLDRTGQAVFSKLHWMYMLCRPEEA